MRRSTCIAALVFLLWLTGCVRRDGRNADCRWPGEPGATVLDPSQPGAARHLSADAEFAEELAIHYTDTHVGPRSGRFESHAAAGAARNQCLGTLLAEVGRTHGVTGQQVLGFLGRNRERVDLAESLPFLLLYGLAAGLMARRVWERYPPADGWTAGVLILLLCSFVFAVGGVLLGEFWATMAENLRIGSGHLSYRGRRLPWVRYRSGLFGMMVVFFWFLAAVIGCRGPLIEARRRSTPPIR